MKTILEIELPECCTKCSLCYITRKERDYGIFYKDYYCIVINEDVGNCDNERYSGCPLKIMETT
jgi:hypothetical protein